MAGGEGFPRYPVRLYLNSLVAINVVIVIVIILFFAYRDRTLSDATERLTYYHAGSTRIAEQGQKFVSDILHIGYDQNVPEHGEIFTGPRSNEELLADLLEQLDSGRDSLLALQQSFGDRQFLDTLQSVDALLDSVLSSAHWTDRAGPPGIDRTRFDLLSLRFRQLARMHMAERDRLLADILSWRAGGFRVALLTSVILLALSSLGAGILIARRVGAISADHVQAIEALRDSEVKLGETARNLAAAQQIAHLGSWEWDIATNRQEWSDETYRIFGLEPGSLDEIDGGTFLGYVHPDDRQALYQRYQATLNSPEPLEIEYRVVCMDGTEKHVAVRGELACDAVGNPRRMSGTMLDITERKRVEHALYRLNAELEQRVEERNAELKAAQEELLRTERLATLGKLTATVSHELRNPLAVIRTSVFAIEKKADEGWPGIAAAIGRIDRNVRRCDRIIDEMLDFTRIRDLQREPLAIDDWLAALIEEHPIPDGIILDGDLAIPGVTAMADPERLRRAVVNVVDNALQSMADLPTGAAAAAGAVEKRLIVRTRTDGGRLQMVFEDSGPGIPAAERARIFEPLFSTRNFGVGLGLAVVSQIMDQHDGGVEVGEAFGGGARFVLWLPLEQEAALSDTLF